MFLRHQLVEVVQVFWKETWPHRQKNVRDLTPALTCGWDFMGSTFLVFLIGFLHYK